MASSADRRRAAPTPIVPLPGALPEPVAGRLPIPPTPLIGRRAELAAALARLTDDDVRLLTLTGTGGIGKTRLALALAEAAERGGCFPGGVWFVALDAVSDPADVAGAIARAVAGGATAGDVIDALRRLRNRAALLILDNCEHVLPGLAVVADLLAEDPALTVLATSRARLRLRGERVFSVPPLSLGEEPDPSGADHETAPYSVRCAPPSEAVALFVERAAAVAPGFVLDAANGAAVAEICRRLDGLPLAIELAAAWIAVLPPAALLERLDPPGERFHGARLPLLVGGSRDAPARQRTLRDAIAWSYDLLGPEEQATLRRLAVLVGGVALEAAEAVVGEAGAGRTYDRERSADTVPPAPHVVLAAIAALAEKSLLVAETGAAGVPRFRMLETIREFALERLADAGEEDAARRAHAAYFARLADDQGSGWGRDWPGGADALAAEQGNLRAALTWTLERGPADDALRLAAAFGRQAQLRGDLREAQAPLARALSQGANASPVLRARATLALGCISLYLGDYDAASDRLLEALSLFRRGEDPTGAAHTLYYLAALAEYQGEEATAVARYEEGLNLARKVGLRRLTGHLLSCLADAAYRAGDPRRALALDEEALAVLRAAGDDWGVVLALTGVAQAACALGELERALALLREAAELARELEYGVGLADTLAGVAAVAAAVRRPVEAARLLGATAAAQERVGYPVLPHHAQQGRTADAVRGALGDGFAPAFEAGRALSAEAALAEALALDGARGVAASPRRPASSPDALTARELEIVRLLAQRRTNAEIAEALSISLLTVTTHVARIRAKLGVRSRHQAAEEAVRRGLV